MPIFLVSIGMSSELVAIQQRLSHLKLILVNLARRSSDDEEYEQALAEFDGLKARLDQLTPSQPSRPPRA